MDFVALDFETANEKRDSACAVGITVVRNGVVVDTDYRLIRPPEMRFEYWNVRVHGISAEDVSDCPTFAETWPEISELLQGQLVVAHNASFDFSVLRHTLYTYNIDLPSLSYLCTLKLSRRVWPELASHSLGFLAETHGLELEHHHAGSDSKAAAELLLLAARQNEKSCARELAATFSVSVGEIYSDGNWLPSSGPGVRKQKETIEITFPEGYEASTHPFFGKSVAFTGTLTMFSRQEAQRVVEIFGGHPKTTVSKNTDYLVVGVNDLRKLAAGQSKSSKLRKADELRQSGHEIYIISDVDFQQFVLHPGD